MVAFDLEGTGMGDETGAGSGLAQGGHGREVADLQAALIRDGEQPGPADGSFGRRTAEALRRFQARYGLVNDGVAGPATWAALVAGRVQAAADGKLAGPTMGGVQRMFPATPRAPIARNLPIVLGALTQFGLLEPRLVLVALATIRAEAEGFEPVEERVSAYNTTAGGHAFDRYDHRADLGNEGPPDGAVFRGRGYVQLTGRANYARSGLLAGHPGLEEQPHLACEPAVAAQLLAVFLRSRREQVEAALDSGDLAAARRAVNGGTHGLERFSEAYEIGAREWLG